MPCSAPAAGPVWPPTSACPCSDRCRSTRRWPPGGDAGEPVALDDDQPLAAEFARIAAALVDNPPVDVAMEGCSARMLDRVEAAVAAGETA